MQVLATVSQQRRKNREQAHEPKAASKKKIPPVTEHSLTCRCMQHCQIWHDCMADPQALVCLELLHSCRTVWVIKIQVCKCWFIFTVYMLTIFKLNCCARQWLSLSPFYLYSHWYYWWYWWWKFYLKTKHFSGIKMEFAHTQTRYDWYRYKPRIKTVNI